MHGSRVLAFDDTCIVSTCKYDNKDEQVERIRWEDVQRVCAYKKDCYAVDQIRIELLDGSAKGILITEEMPGWDAVVNALPLQLPGCLGYDEWFRVVAFPAFEQNMTLLYERKGKPGESPSK